MSRRPIHIDPYMGRLSHHVKPLCEATSTRIILGNIYLNSKSAWELKEHLRGK
jgi:hypothetical protein